jgi:hypothetical protein
LEKQADGNIIAGLGGDEVVAESVGKWRVCWGAAKGRIRDLVWQGCEAIGSKI